MASNVAPVKFPHYKPEEIELAKRFIATKELKGSWQFSVPLETPASLKVKRDNPDVAPGEALLWCKWIDAVVETDKEIVIVEFSERIRDSAIGHLMTYDRLYRIQYMPKKPLRLMVVAHVDDAAVRATLDSLGIEWRIV